MSVVQISSEDMLLGRHLTLRVSEYQQIQGQIVAIDFRKKILQLDIGQLEPLAVSISE